MLKKSLKINQSIIDIVELVNTMYGVDVDVSSLDYVSNIATTEDFINYVFSQATRSHDFKIFCPHVH